MGFIWASPTAVMVCAGGPKKNRRDCVNQNVRSLSIKKYAPNPHKILRHATARWIVLWDVGIHMNSVVLRQNMDVNIFPFILFNFFE